MTSVPLSAPARASIALLAGRSLRSRTVRVVVAVLFIIACVVFFRLVPGSLRWPARAALLALAAWLIVIALRAALAVRPTGKKLAFSLILGGFFYLALWLICHVFLLLMGRRDDRAATHAISSLGEIQRRGITAMLDGSSFEMYDRETGWQPRPGRWPDGTINSQGVRSLRDYAIPPPDPAKRFLCVGDSFTIGDSVSDTETYPCQAEQLWPGTDWVNLGISGACMTQALIQYRKNGKKFGGRHVVIGFMTDDAKRTVNCFRPFLADYNPFTKPFAKFSEGRFSIEPNPYQDISDYRRLLGDETREIARLKGMDYLTWSNQAAETNPVLRTARYVAESLDLTRTMNDILARPPPPKPARKKEPRYAIDPYARVSWDENQRKWTRKDRGVDPYGRAIWDPSSLGFIAVARLFDAFCKEIVSDGRIPFIVIIPGPADVENHERGLPRVYAAMVEHFRARGYRHLDFLDPLVARHKDDLSIESLYLAGHFRAHMNRELAEEVVRAMRPRQD
jgi:hypothetical protein